MKKNIRLRVSAKDRERLEFVAAVHQTSLSGAARMAIVAMWAKLTGKSPDDLVKENSTPVQKV